MENSGETLGIVIPCFNEWEALRLLIPRIFRVLAGSHWRPVILVVDDASTEPLPADWPPSVEILHLRCNLGHQRAIALGLYQMYSFSGASAVIVMDGDGEDRAEDLPALLEEFELGQRKEIVFAARGKRMESAVFQFFYSVYRWLHVALTGIEVRVGNFSILPRTALTRLMAVSDLWNHYAAAVYRARLPHRRRVLDRGRRLAGKSKMNFVSLMVHGFTAMSVFSDQVGARVLAASAALSVSTALAAGVCWLLGLQGWATSAVGWMGIFAVQALTFAVLFVFTIVSRRSATNFILLRDAQFFILSRTGGDLDRLGRRLADERETALHTLEPPKRLEPLKP